MLGRLFISLVHLTHAGSFHSNKVNNHLLLLLIIWYMCRNVHFGILKIGYIRLMTYYLNIAIQV